MFRKMPIILLALIALIYLADSFLPLPLKEAIYALGLSVKSLIIFVLPFLIFMLLFKTIAQLSKKATKLILFILVAVCCSNFLSTMISYHVGAAIYHFDLAIILPAGTTGLAPAWTFDLPKLIANDQALFAGILSGILCSFLKPNLAQRLSHHFDKWVGYLLNGLSYVVPLFISGFIVKLVHDKTISHIISDYSVIFLLVAISQFSYVALVYLISNRFHFPTFIQNIRNMLPATIAGFSSMSSAAAMPLTIIGAEKNCPNPQLTRLAIPTTVNIHLTGDCFAIPIFAFAIMKNFGFAEPTFLAYLIFALFFVIAKFSVAGIPGGGVLVMLPVLETHLGFNAEMCSLITALYILFDPVITCANVLGNGGFTLALNRIQARWSKRMHLAR